jgi:hypothetical protein
LESASGRRGSPAARNRDYDAALELLLSRMGAAGFRITDAVIESSEALANFPDADDRRLNTNLGFPISPAAHDARELRLALGRAQKSTARRPGAESTGNANKRIRLDLDLPTAFTTGSQVESYLAGLSQSTRSLPDALCVYVARPSLPNLDLGLEQGVWGFPSPVPEPRRAAYVETPVGSLVLFGYGHGGTNERGAFEAGTLERLYVCRVTELYFEDSDPIWPVESNQQLYESRIGIELVGYHDSVPLVPDVSLNAEVVEAFRSGFRSGQGFVADPTGSALLDPIIAALPPVDIPLEGVTVPPVGAGEHSGQGIQTDPVKRKLIETVAEDEAEAFYDAQGYSVTRVGPLKLGYDLRCEHPTEPTRHVEVKGTTGLGDSVRLTVGEVKWAIANSATTDLFVQSRIQVRKDAAGYSVASTGTRRYAGAFEPTGGQPFDPVVGPLTAKQFDFLVPI